jgi:hypothetical protein
MLKAFVDNPLARARARIDISRSLRKVRNLLPTSIELFSKFISAIKTLLPTCVETETSLGNIE